MAKKTRQRKPRESSVLQSIAEARRKRRNKDVVAACDRIGQLTDEASESLPLTSDGMRFVAGGLLRLLVPATATLKIRMQDGSDIPLDGQQLRDVGDRLLHGAMWRTMLEALLKDKPQVAEPVCGCGHKKDEHVRDGIVTKCLGKPAVGMADRALGVAPDPLCHCRWFAPAVAPAEGKT
jgi:hypothetical protein